MSKAVFGQNGMLKALAVDPGCCLTLAEVTAKTGVEYDAASRTIGRLVSRGLVERVRPGCYRLNETGHLALTTSERPIKRGPKGRHSGPRRPPKNTFRERLWRALRREKKGTLSSLIPLAVRDEENPIGGARRYFRWLASVGVIVEIARIGSAGEIRWLLVRDLGPLAPNWSDARGALYDPNKGEWLRPEAKS